MIQRLREARMKLLQKLSTSQFKLGVYAGSAGWKRYAEKLRDPTHKSRSYRGIVMLNRDSTLTPRVPKTQSCARQGHSDPLCKLQRQPGPEGAWEPLNLAREKRIQGKVKG